MNVSFKCNVERLVVHVEKLLSDHESVQIVAIEGAIMNAMDIAMKLKESGHAEVGEVVTSLEDISTRITGEIKPRSKLTIMVSKSGI